MIKFMHNGVQVRSSQLNLKSTLVNGQCFNWWPIGDSEKEYIGVIASSVVLIKESDQNIEYQFLQGNTDLVSYFNLDVDMNTLLERWNEDAFFKTISKDYGGLRIVKQDPLECLISFIVSQNNHIKRITNNLQSIRAFGTPLLKHNKFQYYAFPTLEQLSKVTQDDFDKIGVGYRAQYLYKTAQKLYELGNTYLQELYGKDCLQELLQFHGVGRKVADCVRLYSLGANSIVPVDTHINQIYVEKYKQKKGDSHDKIQEFFKERLGEYAGWAQSYLFTSQLTTHSKSKKPTTFSKSLKL